MKIYLVLHHELIGLPDDSHPDDVVMHVASSKKKALKFIKRVIVDKGTFWQIVCYKLDNIEFIEKNLGYYKRNGKKRKNGCYKGLFPK